MMAPNFKAPQRADSGNDSSAAVSPSTPLAAVRNEHRNQIMTKDAAVIS